MELREVFGVGCITAILGHWDFRSLLGANGTSLGEEEGEEFGSSCAKFGSLLRELLCFKTDISWCVRFKLFLEMHLETISRGCHIKNSLCRILTFYPLFLSSSPKPFVLHRLVQELPGLERASLTGGSGLDGYANPMSHLN